MLSLTPHRATHAHTAPHHLIQTIAALDKWNGNSNIKEDKVNVMINDLINDISANYVGMFVHGE